MDLNHLHLRCSDVEASVAFYCENFDFRPTEQTEQRKEGGAFFLYNQDGFTISIAKEAAAAPVEKARLPDWFHYSFRLESIEKVEELFLKLRASGAPIVEEITQRDGCVFFRCQDPGGFPLEVYCGPEPMHN
jgi:catechol 2,3-dioxygenase-like lactoylglutathione lyase family enzyme